jgi:hypothetical protein
MKKYLWTISAIILIVIASCQQKPSILTEEQKATIEKEVKGQFNEYISTRNQLNFDLWSKFWDSEEFISANALNFGALMSYSAWMDSVKISFERRERHYTEVLDLQTNALTSEIVVLTSKGIFENWWSGNYRKSNGIETQIWKRRPDGWKIIYVHESGKLIEEKMAE